MSCVDVGVLTVLFSAAEQDDKLIAVQAEVDSIPWAIVDSQFVNPIAKRFAVTIIMSCCILRLLA